MNRKARKTIVGYDRVDEAKERFEDLVALGATEQSDREDFAKLEAEARKSMKELVRAENICAEADENLDQAENDHDDAETLVEELTTDMEEELERVRKEYEAKIMKAEAEAKKVESELEQSRLEVDESQEEYDDAIAEAKDAFEEIGSLVRDVTARYISAQLKVQGIDTTKKTAKRKKATQVKRKK